MTLPGSFAESTGATTDNGNVNGATSFAAGKFGSAASLPGGGGNNISVADSAASSAGGLADDIDRTDSDVTISLWIQASAWNVQWQGIFAHGEQSDYRIARQSNTDPAQIAYAGGISDIQSTTTITAGDGMWHHIVATTAEGGVTQIFVDGVPAEATSATGASIAQSNANNNVLLIGGNPDNGREFQGLIDDAAMWDRVLSTTEVEQIYLAGQAGVALGAIPEPSIGLLASLAGLLMIIRRRR